MLILRKDEVTGMYVWQMAIGSDLKIPDVNITIPETVKDQNLLSLINLIDENCVLLIEKDTLIRIKKAAKKLDFLVEVYVYEGDLLSGTDD